MEEEKNNQVIEPQSVETPEVNQEPQIIKSIPVEKSTKEKKSNPFIIILLVLVIVGLLGYIAYDKGVFNKFMNQKTEKETNHKEKEEEKKKEEEKVVELLAEEIAEWDKKINTLTTYFANYYKDNNITSIDNQQLLNYGIRTAMKDNIATKEDVEKAIKDLFGNSIVPKHENVKCFVASHPDVYLFESDAYQYNNNHPGHGGSEFYRYNIVKYQSSEKTNTTLKLNYKILYYNECKDTCLLGELYARLDDTEPLVSFKQADGSYRDDAKLTDELYENIKDKVPVTTFTYEIDKEGNYNLKSVEINEE